MAAGICDGLAVVEMGAGSMPASLVGMVLADNGARVIKVEPPEGDRLRTQLPSGFLVWNRGKESRIIDLRTPEGRDEAQDLAGHADVLIEGFAAGTAERWDLGYEQLRAKNPSLVYCSIKGFGSDGAYAHLKAYEALVAAKAGVFSRGEFGFRPGPIYTGVPLAGHGAAHMAIGGVLAALMVRERTGRGQRVEATMVQGLNPLDAFGTMHWQYAKRTGKQPHVIVTPSGGALAATRYAVVTCTKDGRFIASVPQLPHQARALIRAAGLERTLADPRFENAPQFPTPEDAQVWEDLLWEAFRTKTLAEWLPAMLAEPDLPFEVMVSSEEGLDHPQFVHNGNVITINDPTHGEVRQVGPVAAFDATPSVIERSAPALGDHCGPLTGPSASPGREPAPDHPLAGVTILEFGYFFAMPFALAMAASLGARVIKLEDSHGDPMRSGFGVKESGAVKTMEGKESLAVDMSTAEGQQIVHRLVATADAFVLSFRPGVAERLKVDYDTLAKVNPRLVYVHGAGYGTTGPYAHRPQYAWAASAVAGSFHRQAGYWLDPELTTDFGVMELQAIIAPRLRGITDGDANATLALFSSLMLGLCHQRRSGQGQFLSASMIGGNAYAYSDDFNSYSGKPPVPMADPEQYGLSSLYRLYEAESGWVFVAAPTQKEWEALAVGIDRTDLLEDDRFATASQRQANDDALADVLAGAIATRGAREWEELLTAKGVGCVEVYEGGISGFTNTDPVMRETGLVAEVDHPIFGRILRHGLPVAMSETPGRIAPSCLCGEHTIAILGELGYSPDQIEAMKGSGVVFTSP